MDNNGFEFTGNVEVLTIPSDPSGTNLKKKKVEAGVFSFPGLTDVFFQSKYYHVFITKDILEKRLKFASTRKSDYDTIKASHSAHPFELLDWDGDTAAFPARLVPTSGPYNDKDQLKLWIDFASNLVTSGPTERVNPIYCRFHLKPTDLQKASIKVYFTPAPTPICGVDSTLLRAVIEKNLDDFAKWPQHEVLEYADAQTRGLKLVGENFLKLYFTWMDPNHYHELWSNHNISSLALPFPKNDPSVILQYEEIAKGLKSGKETVDGRGITITTQKMASAVGMRSNNNTKDLKKVMGKSATTLVKLWGNAPPTTKMGGNIQAEWLHRSSFAYGGLKDALSLRSSNDANNLIFGSWECNTDMIRAENFVTQLVQQVGKGNNAVKFKGTLTTTSSKSGDVSRREVVFTNPTEAIPAFLTSKNYSWLCFELDYLFEMKAAQSPLGCNLVAHTGFEPWSLYVPLAIEPRMDVALLRHLKEEHFSTLSPSSATFTLFSTLPTSRLQPSQLTTSLGAPVNLPSPDLETGLPTLAWNAAKSGLPSIELSGLVIKNPKVAQPPLDPTHHIPIRLGGIHDPTPHPGVPDVLPPAQGFVLQGDVEIFGTPVVGQLEKWIGPPPSDVVVGIVPPCIERVTLSDDFHLSAIIPLLEGTPFDKIPFRNVIFYHQNYAFDKTKAIGWHFNADWVIDPSCGILYDILRSVLKVNEPVLHIHTMLGTNQRWNAPLSIHSLILEGVFSGLTLAPIPGVHLTTIGVRILGIRGFELNPKPHTTLSYGFGVFGTMKLDVPGSILPLDLTYQMRTAGSLISMSAELSGDIWENALGVQNMMLEDVLLTTSFSTSSPWKSLVFTASATFTYLTSQTLLSGTFTPGGQFALTAEFDDFGTREIDAIFYTLFGDSLTLPDFDIHIDSATFSIVSGEGLSLSLHNVEIAGHTALDVAVSFTKSGASLSGALSTKAISFGEVSIHDAILQVSFWTDQKKKQVDFMLGGTLVVDFLDLGVEAAVHLYPGEKDIEWAVIAKLSSLGHSIALSDVVSAIEKGSFLDLSLKEAMIIAASKDNPTMIQAFPGYTVHQGVQVAAIIDSIPPLNSLLRQNVTGLVLGAGWSKATGFSLGVALPASTSLDLGNGIRTTPISLEIRTDPLELAVIAGLSVPIQDSTPLDFSFVLAANVTGANASAEMDGWWVKPFGIDRLKIGPTVMLSIEIIYTQLLSTGTPSGFGLAGGLMIGSMKANVTMNISENPQRQILSGSLKKLGVSDLVEFAGEIIQEDIPKVPDLIRFEELSIYVCPFGVVLGTIAYPQGFSFKADLILLQKRANIECNIDKANKSISIAGGLDSLELGPLSVHGLKGPRAELECQLGVSKQELLIDGAVSLFDMQAQTYINLQFLPHPQFKFYTLLQFANVFMYQLDAELLGSLGTSLKGADFSLYADLENHILEYVAQQVVEQLEAAKLAASQGLEAAQEKVNQAKREWLAGVDEAERKLNDARHTWQSHEKSIRESSQPIIDSWLNEISMLQGDIDNARHDFNNALHSAESAVEKANRDRAAAMDTAKRGVQNAQSAMDDAIRDAERALDEAKAELASIFGNAQRAIDSAQQNVWSLENQINDLKSTIHEYEDAPWHHFWKKGAIPGLWTAVGALEASKAIASGTLDAARAVLHGTEYVTKEGAVESARGAVKLAQETGQAGLSAAKGVLQAADETSEFAVNRANDVLKGVQTGTEFVALQGAREALELFKQANRAAYEAAVSAIEGLMKSAEYLAFTAAQAGLEIAKNFTALLDAANETLKLAEKATDTVLTVLADIVKFGARAVNIESIILSGTLRGVLGIQGSNSQPLSAFIKGYLLGNQFELNITFDSRDVVAFIKLIFKHVWNILTGGHEAIPEQAPLLELPENRDDRKGSDGRQPPRDTYSLPDLADERQRPRFPHVPMEPFPLPYTPDKDRLTRSSNVAPPQSQHNVDQFTSTATPHLMGASTTVAAPLYDLPMSGHELTLFTPAISVGDQVKPLSFTAAKARFVDSPMKVTTPEYVEQAKKVGLVVLPRGPFTAGPPQYL